MKNKENNTMADKAKEMNIEPLASFLNHLGILADEDIERSLKHEALFGFLQTKCLGKTFQEWHGILTDGLPIDFQLIHNGKDQIKLFNHIYDRFKIMFDEVVKHIFDSDDYTPCFVAEFAKGNLMVNTLENVPVGGFKLTITYRKYSPATKDDKRPIMAINFIVL